jgi:hypothetical protein
MMKIEEKDLKYLEGIIKEAKELKKLYKERNGNCSMRVPNKDLLLWLIKDKYGQDNRMNILENKMKYLQLMFISCIVVIGIKVVIG